MQGEMQGFAVESMRRGAALLAAVLFGVLAAAPAAAQLTFTRTASTCGGLLSGGGYVPGETLTLTIAIERAGASPITAMGLTETLPPGWVTVGQPTGPGVPNLAPPNGSSGALDFAWFSIPAFPATFSYTISTAASGTGETLTGLLEYREGGGPLFSPVVDTALTANGACPAPSACVTMDRTLPSGYTPGVPANVSISLTSTCVDPVTALSVIETLPAGWTASNASGATLVGQTGDEATFSLDPVPGFPASFTYDLTAPAGATSVACVSGVARHTTGGIEPDPVAVVDCFTGPPCVSFTRDAIDCPAPGSSFVVTVNMAETCALPLEAISLFESLPAGWQVLSVGGGVPPNFGFNAPSQRWVFTWPVTPLFPFDFTYTVSVPGDTAAAFSLSGLASYRTAGGPEEIGATVTSDCVVSCALRLNGNQTETAQCGGVYSDPGARAECTGSLPPGWTIATLGSVDTTARGFNTLRYELRDAGAGVVDFEERIVEVVDTTAPALTLVGNSSLLIECGTPYVESGATASDACDGDLTPRIVIAGLVDTSTPGFYNLTYNVSDDAGNAATALTRAIAVNDSTGPSLSLLGASTITLTFGQTYSEPGFTATDACDGDLSGSVQVTGTVNPNLPGTYIISYIVSDGVGRSATANRTVNVQFGPPPTLTLLGPANVAVECGSGFADPGASATDAVDGNITNRVQVAGSVDASEPGVYVLTYTVQNLRGQSAAPLTRTVTVSDTAAPAVVLLGSADETVECGGVYTELGAAAGDACDGVLTGSIAVSGAVDTAVPGVYTLTYSVSDAAGNVAAPAVRTVTVADTTAPLLALNGAASVTVECGAGFVDPGATASDTCDGDLNGAIVTLGVVNAGAPGDYVVQYRVEDAAGNRDSAVRTVRVEDTTAPSITLLGEDPQVVACDSVYVDPGAAASDACDAAAPVTSDAGAVVDTAVPGPYRVTYTAADDSGNVRTAQRSVIVEACGEGEGEGEPEGEGDVEGEGEDPCAAAPAALFETVAPAFDLSYQIGDNTAGAEVELRARFEFAELCGGTVEVRYEIAGEEAGFSRDLLNDFPVTVVRGLGEYNVVAVATVLETGYQLAAATRFRVERGLDVDGNGYLDDPFSLDEGGTWAATVQAGAAARSVSMVLWAGTSSGGKTSYNTWAKADEGAPIALDAANPDRPEQRLSVSAPRSLAQAGELAVLMIAVSDTLEGLYAPADAGALEATLPSFAMAGAAFFDVTLLVSQDGGLTYDEMPANRLAANPVTLALGGLGLTEGLVPGFHAYPTEASAGLRTGVVVTPGAGAWSNVAVQNITFAGDTLRAEATSLSAFAPIERELAPPRLSISPNPGEAFDFGEIVPGTQVSQDFVVTNIGGGVLEGSAVLTGNQGAFSLAGVTAYSLPEGASATVTLSFAPARAGQYAATFSVSGGDLGTRSFRVRGEGSGKTRNFFGCGAVESGRSGRAGDMAVLVLAAGALALARRRSARAR